MNLIVSKARKGLDFHIDPISIELETDTITELDPEELSDQLEAMGLSCPHTKGKLLERNIQDVLSRIETGPLETFGVYRDHGPLSNDQLAGLGISPSGTAFNEELLQSVLQKQFERKANGNWAENNLGKFTYKLFVLQNKDNFEYLKKNCDDFPFTENSKTNIGKVTTVQAIKDLFTDTTSVCTAATVEGINEESLKAIFSNALETLDTSVLENDYEQSDNRVITLLLNYDPNNKTCDGVGILTCEWTIKIKNYKEKKSEIHHETTISVNARSILYNNEDLIKKHYDIITSKKNLLGFQSGNDIKPDFKVEVYDKMPYPGEDIFNNSLPLKSDTNSPEVMVFYTAGVHLIGHFDNTQSDASQTYTRSVTVGFSTSTSVSISSQHSFEINAQFVKAGFSLGFSVSLTNQWSESRTESVSITVPKREQAFFYQATLCCRKMKLDTKTGNCEYISSPEQLLTNVYITTENPIEGAD